MTIVKVWSVGFTLLSLCISSLNKPWVADVSRDKLNGWIFLYASFVLFLLVILGVFHFTFKWECFKPWNTLFSILKDYWPFKLIWSQFSKCLFGNFETIAEDQQSATVNESRAPIGMQVLSLPLLKLFDFKIVTSASYSIVKI